MDEIQSLSDDTDLLDSRYGDDLPRVLFRPFYELSHSEEWREKLVTLPSEDMNFP